MWFITFQHWLTAAFFWSSVKIDAVFLIKIIVHVWWVIKHARLHCNAIFKSIWKQIKQACKLSLKNWALGLRPMDRWTGPVHHRAPGPPIVPVPRAHPLFYAASGAYARGNLKLQGSQDRTTDRFLYVAGQSHRSRSVSVSLDRATDRYLNVTGQSDRSRSVSVSVNRSLGLSLQPYK